MILNTGSIKNVRIGDYCRICGTCRLYNGSINSNEVAPVHIGHGVICDDFIISTGVYVDDGAMLSPLLRQARHASWDTTTLPRILCFSATARERTGRRALFLPDLIR